MRTPADVMTEFWRHLSALSDWSSAEGWAPALALMAADVRIVEPPSLPYGGERTGPDAYRALVGEIARLWRPAGGFSREEFAHGSEVIYRSKGPAQAVATGTSFNVETMTQWSVRNGRITEVYHFYFDTNIVLSALGLPARKF